MHGQLCSITLKGSWNDMGCQYGHLLKTQLYQILDFAEQRATAESDAYLLPDGLPCGIAYLDDFFSGMSKGSGLSLQDLVRINGIEVAYGADLVALFGEKAAGKCSALALFGTKTKDGSLICGRNYDWLPSFAEIDLVLTRLCPEGSNREFMALNYPGCFYLTTGMNSSGLFLELNAGMFASAARRPEITHNAWLLWDVLLHADTTGQALTLLKAMPPQSCYLIGVADAKECASFEWGVPTSAVIAEPPEKGYLAMSNHFVQSGWINLPEADGSMISSVRRRQCLLNLAAKIPDHSADIDTMKSLLAVPVESGGAKWAGTLFQVIARPGIKEMQIRPGSQHWTSFSF